MPQLFLLTIAIEAQCIFPDADVVEDPGGDVDDVLPSDEALQRLTTEIEKALRSVVRIGTIEVEALEHPRGMHGLH